MDVVASLRSAAGGISFLRHRQERQFFELQESAGLH